ncbi:hypothetical protein SJAV_27520 [Sulfurisphaera javensis]|uniref:Tc1-like transposase DDE domain-containing protein n=2 Tax=Sulfurisphaera javensis TaxID=2049879 RepID=A0AAT9GV48_9CREN
MLVFIRVVLDAAEELGITLVFLPPYSGLNLIEFVWKDLKRCVNSYYTFPSGLLVKMFNELVSKGNYTRYWREKFSDVLARGGVVMSVEDFILFYRYYLFSNDITYNLVVV